MTRLVTTGWETGNPDENQTGAPDATWTAVTSTPSPKAPSVYCLRAGASATKWWTLAAAKTDLYSRLRVYTTSTQTIGGLITLYDSAAAQQVHLDWSPSDNFLRVYRGAGTTNLIGGPSSLPMPTATWHLLEMRWQASSTTSGIVQVWLNGTLVINVSGVDNVATANVNVQRFEINGPSGTGVMFIDDLAVNDTAGTINNGQIGDGSVVLLKPTGAGTNTAQTRGGTDSGSNWDQVNEVPVSMTDYVFSATAATRDTYALQDLPAGSWTVNTVEVVAYAQNSDAGAGSLGLTVKSGATTNEGTAQSLGTTAMFLRQQYELDPNTTAAWTNANVNALEAGTTVR
jgi:hypothetical protein